MIEFCLDCFNVSHPASCGMREKIIFDTSFFQTRISHLANVDVGEFLHVFTLVNPHPASHNLWNAGCGVIICLRFGLRIYASRIPQDAERRMRSGLNNLFCCFTIPYSASYKLWNVGCGMINETCDFVFDIASRQTDLDQSFPFYSHLKV